MSNSREKALARLSIAAFAVDAMVVTLLIALCYKALDNLIANVPIWIIFAIIPAVLFLHFLFVELVIGGKSIGRLSTGLRIEDQKTGTIPKISDRAKHCSLVIAQLGIPSLNSQKLPKYNKKSVRCIRSDWAGSVTTPQEPSIKSKPPSVNLAFKNEPINLAKIGIIVTKGPDRNKNIRFSKAPNYIKSSVLLIGSNSKFCDFTLSNDKTVSNIHCRLTVKNNKCLILDGLNANKASTHGTYISDVKVSNQKPSIINIGDIIKIGNSEFTIANL